VKMYQCEYNSHLVAAKGMCRLVVIVVIMVIVVIDFEWDCEG
jgi:hypothetical protein